MMTLLQCDGMKSWVHECSVCIPGQVASLVKMAYTAILIAVPLLLIITGMITLASSIMKQKEEDIKKAQQLLVKKFVAGAIVFFLFILIRWLVAYFDGNLADCFDALINYNETEHACTYNANGEVVGTNCSKTNNNNEFFDINNQCINQGADGAVRIVKTYYGPNGQASGYDYICYEKDFEHCSCSKGTPFRYADKDSNNTKCWCAIGGTDSNGYHYVWAANGTQRN